LTGKLTLPLTADHPDFIASPPPGRGRALVSVFIVLYLLWQAAVPLSYYLGDDLDEERFAWRMISGVWFLHRTCALSVAESVEAAGAGGVSTASRRLDLERTLHASSILQLRNNQRPVVTKFLRTRCESDPSVIEVEFNRTCALASRMPPVHLRFDCRSRALAETRKNP
jgi:hypothetical protein